MAEEFRLQLSADATKVESEISKITGKTYTLRFSTNGSRTEVTKYTDDLGRATTETTKYNSQNKLLSTTLKTVDNNYHTLGQTLSNTLSKVLQFGTATAIIAGVVQAMHQAVEVVKEYDAALTDFKKVSDLSGESLSDYTKKLGTLGESVARTKTEMIQGAT
jgi:hypothetical protein